MPPVKETWSIGGIGIIWGIILLFCTIILSTFIWKKSKNFSRLKYLPTAITIAIGYLLVRLTAGPAIESIEGFEAAKTGYLGGFGAPSTSAEKYFHYTLTELLNSPATVYAGRLPYGTGTGDGFGFVGETVLS